MKICKKCGHPKELEEFYKMRGNADGRSGKCIECTNKYIKGRRLDPISRPLVLASDNARFQKADRKRQLIEYQRNRRRREREKYIARNAVSNAIRDGRLHRRPCEVCGHEDTQAHHDDYSKPLEVRWMCFQHHREIAHGQIVELK
jgi:hypothetical protein